MPDSFDAFRYIGYMRSRWRWIAASCGIAVALALAVTLFQTRQYTATARIVIEPPAGSDLRSAMAVSPIYLESLKTYEQFASSDSLFRKALDQFDLRASLGSRPIESLKRSILKVGIVRNTRILEIAATLPDPRKAQALAHFMAAVYGGAQPLAGERGRSGPDRRHRAAGARGPRAVAGDRGPLGQIGVERAGQPVAIGDGKRGRVALHRRAAGAQRATGGRRCRRA